MEATSISSSGPAAQLISRQLMIQQARRNAEQAEQNARTLQNQAEQARQEAGRMQENARALSVQSDQAQSDAGRARQGLSALRSVADMQSRLSNTATQVVERQATKPAEALPPAVAPAAVPATVSAPPVVNAQGQLTGTVISTEA